MTAHSQQTLQDHLQYIANHFRTNREAALAIGVHECTLAYALRQTRPVSHYLQVMMERADWVNYVERNGRLVRHG